MVELSREHTIKATDPLRQAKKRIFESILVPFNSQIYISWTEEFCQHLDELAGEDH